MTLNKVIKYYNHNGIHYKIICKNKSEWMEKSLIFQYKVKIKSKIGPFFLRTVFNKDYIMAPDKNPIALAKEEYFEIKEN